MEKVHETWEAQIYPVSGWWEWRDVDEVIYPSRPVLTIQVCWGSVMSGLPSVGQVYIQKCYVLKKKSTEYTEWRGFSIRMTKAEFARLRLRRVIQEAWDIIFTLATTEQRL